MIRIVDGEIASRAQICEILKHYLRTINKTAAELWESDTKTMNFAHALANTIPNFPGSRGENLKAFLDNGEKSILEAIEASFAATVVETSVAAPALGT